MVWKIIKTSTFSKSFKRFKSDGSFVFALDKKIKNLRGNPEGVGGHLSGRLYGMRSTRIIRKFRLIFKVNVEKKLVYLIAIDHRKFDYERF